MSIYTLGPAGTFSEAAAIELFSDDESIELAPTIEEIVERVVDGSAKAGVLPVENNISGFVDESISAMQSSPVVITGEITLNIEHCLAGFSTLEKAGVLFVQPHTYEQCKEKINRLCPHCEVVFTTSNGESASKLLEPGQETALAIVSKHAANLYKLPIIESGLSMAPSATRFCIIERSDAPRETPTRHFLLLHPHEGEQAFEEEVKALFSKNLVSIDRLESLSRGDLETIWIECSGMLDSCLLVMRELNAIGTLKQLGGI